MFFSRSLFGMVVAAATLLGSAVGAEAPTCDCKTVADSFIVTRLWNVINEEWTDQMVIDEFDQGFAPAVTHLEGFQEYASALTGDPKTVFFMNIFETQELAKAAQEGAKDFVQKGVLNGAITPNQFTENSLEFHIASVDCIKDSFNGKYMGTQIWTLKTDDVGNRIGNLTLTDVAAEFESGFGPTVSGSAGFLEYGGALVTATDFVFFYNVFDSIEGVQEANAGTEEFVAGNALLAENIEKIVITEGVVGFDYTCSAGNAPETETESTSAASASLFTLSSLMTALLAMPALPFV